MSRILHGPRRNQEFMLNALHTVLTKTFKELGWKHSITASEDGLEISERVWVKVVFGSVSVEEMGAPQMLGIFVHGFTCDHFVISASCSACEERHERGKFGNVRSAAMKICEELMLQELNNIMTEMPPTWEEEKANEPVLDEPEPVTEEEEAQAVETHSGFISISFEDFMRKMGGLDTDD